MLLKKKSPKDVDPALDGREDEVIESDFIPYACHYDANTLLTKNGELLQCIKITGFAGESVGGDHIKLREAVRQAVMSSIPNNDYAIWFHTIRRRTNLDPGGDFQEGSFPKYLNRRWGEAHQWDKKFTNELYITIAHDSQEVGISRPKDYMRALWPPAHKRYRFDFLRDTHQDLDRVVQNMLGVLQLFGAKRLSIVEREGVCHSEPLEFLGKIINLEATEVVVPPQDLSEYITSRDVAFGFNVVEVWGKNKRHYGTVLTVKEYREITTQALDVFLQMPREFIVVQCVDFINAHHVKNIYQYHEYIQRLSEDNDLARMSGLNDILQSDKGRSTDYGEHQLCILLVEDSIAELEKAVEEAMDRLGKLGIVSMREDIRLEECYWSLLPGNFEFVTRLKPINTSRVGGFASLHNFPAGQMADNHWGPAVTVFYTAAKTPYFFNFHQGNNGHTAIIGPFGAGKTVLLNFLCSEAQKFHPRLFFFDMERGSEVFLRALNGQYHMMTQDTQAKRLALNPLLLPDSDATRHFLAEWLWVLMTHGGVPVTQEEVTAIQQVVPRILSLPPQQRRLSQAAEMFQQVGAARLAAALAPWHGGGELAYLFDHAADTLNLEGMVHGFEMGSIVKAGAPLKPLMLYLLHRIAMMLDGRPTLVVLDEAWKMLDNDLFAPKIAPWLTLLRERNALAILATESVEEASQSNISSNIMDQMATQIYLANRKAGDAYQRVFRLNDQEYDLLTRLRLEKRHFLLKHGADAVVAELNLAGMDDLLCVLTGTPERVAIFDEVVRQKGTDPVAWLDAYRQRCDELTHRMEREEEQRRKEEEERLADAMKAAFKKPEPVKPVIPEDEEALPPPPVVVSQTEDV